VNDNRAKSEDASLWYIVKSVDYYSGSGTANLDCARSYFRANNLESFFAKADTCSNSYGAICEKRIEI